MGWGWGGFFSGVLIKARVRIRVGRSSGAGVEIGDHGNLWIYVHLLNIRMYQVPSLPPGRWHE